MRKYNIKVMGQSYEVEVEEISVNSQPVVKNIQTSPAPAAPVAVVAAPAEAAAAPVENRPAVPVNSENLAAITAPMPGKIVRVAVQVGQIVKKGDLIVILEAMKMENEIVSNLGGTIISIHVASGAAVNPGETMVLIG
ncbi:MAG TPA: acetyl-CoA carboxylase biotin carboxyl carrier protein subunit [Peptococcaceae bacterium]|nr:acetyl-CoA carboxylase biotin carboxyl carrier protein subunit [Peptococcaceae bacterium]